MPEFMQPAIARFGDALIRRCWAANSSIASTYRLKLATRPTCWEALLVNYAEKGVRVGGPSLVTASLA